MTKTVFLDLDGTLTDPKVGITKSVIHALETLGQIAPHPDDLEWVIGPPLIESFGLLGVDPHEGERIYRERYMSVGLFENTPYPGVLDVLEQMSQRYRLCLMTAKPHVSATRITEKFGIDQYLYRQYGPELDGTRNNKGELLAYALADMNMGPEGCVMVGDRHHDIDAARHVGMPAISVTWGFGTTEEHASADAICEKLSDLPNVVDGLV